MTSENGSAARTPDNTAPAAREEAPGIVCAPRVAKARFDSIYDRPDPTAYFSALRPLRYATPDYAAPAIRRCVAALERLRDRRPVLLEVCAGYGLNGALVKYDVTLDTLYRRYTAGRRCDPAEDRAFFARFRRPQAPEVIGLDVAANALDYARAAGFIDTAIATNLETGNLAGDEVARLAETDLIVVTGGLSYVGQATFRRLFAAMRRTPWVLYVPLCHVPIEELEEFFEAEGMEIERARRSFPQRRFKDAEERRAVAAAFAELGRSAPSKQQHLEAWLKLARPQHEMLSPPVETLLAMRSDTAGRDDRDRSSVDPQGGPRDVG